MGFCFFHTLRCRNIYSLLFPNPYHARILKYPDSDFLIWLLERFLRLAEGLGRSCTPPPPPRPVHRLSAPSPLFYVRSGFRQVTLTQPPLQLASQSHSAYAHLWSTSPFGKQRVNRDFLAVSKVCSAACTELSTKHGFSFSSRAAWSLCPEIRRVYILVLFLTSTKKLVII